MIEEGPQEELATRYLCEDISDSFPRDLRWQFMVNSFIIYFLFFTSNFTSHFRFLFIIIIIFFFFFFLTCGIFFRFRVTPLLVTRFCVTLFSNTPLRISEETEKQNENL